MNRLTGTGSLFTFLACIFCFSAHAFSDTQATVITTDSIALMMEELEKNSIKMSYPIYRVYALSTDSCIEYLFLTEHPYDTQDNDTLNDSIQAFCVRFAEGKYVQKWVLRDFVVKNSNNAIQEESIWFWSKYIGIKDIDRDGDTDFIIVYGTKGLNGLDDGRMKILVFHKGSKFAVRHQNGVLDFERETTIDSSFYGLPRSIQQSVITLIERIITDGNAIFPPGWKNAFKNKRVVIADR